MHRCRPCPHWPWWKHAASTVGRHRWAPAVHLGAGPPLLVHGCQCSGRPTSTWQRVSHSGLHEAQCQRAVRCGGGSGRSMRPTPTAVVPTTPFPAAGTAPQPPDVRGRQRLTSLVLPMRDAAGRGTRRRRPPMADATGDDDDAAAGQWQLMLYAPRLSPPPSSVFFTPAPPPAGAISPAAARGPTPMKR